MGALALAMLGCGGASTTAPKQTATGAVTPESGGTIALPDESVKLDVPPGAVPANTTITMTATDAAAPQGITAVSPVLQFAPDGIVFAKPITVTFTFKNATNPVVYWSNASGGYDLIPGTVYGSTISAPVMHFSKGFVGEEPAGSSATCGAGVACGAGTTCSYGGGGSGGGGAPSGGAASSGTDSGGTTADGGFSSGTHGGAIDAAAPMTDPGSGPKTSALSSGGGTGMCCTCANGVYECSTCAAPSSGGADGGAPLCMEGVSCSQPGASCGTTSGGGGGTSTGAPMSSGDAVAHDASAPAGTGSSSAGSAPAGTGTVPSSGGTCCTCGSDGHLHCGTSCTGAPSSGDHDGGTITGGADASIGPGGGGAAGAGGGGSGGLCMPGDACQPSAFPCRNASPSSCSMCMCGSGGTLVCMPCDSGQPPPSDAGTPTGPQGCVPGAQCAQGGAGCQNASAGGACLACKCDDTGHLACSPCGGTPLPADAGAPPQQACVQGGKCPQPGATCGGVDQVGACTMCACGPDGTLTCKPCP